MKRLLLFSSPTDVVKEQLLPLLFPQKMQQKVFAFMPSEGLHGNEKYVAMSSEWRPLAEQHHAKFVLIDNASQRIEEERAKLQRANIVFITGGNTCVLLNNLRWSGLDQAIVELTGRDEYVLAGYSAGAMILTPSIEYELVAFDPEANQAAGLADFTGLRLLGYEIAPHYIDEDQEVLAEYRKARALLYRRSDREPERATLPRNTPRAPTLAEGGRGIPEVQRSHAATPTRC